MGGTKQGTKENFYALESFACLKVTWRPIVGEADLYIDSYRIPCFQINHLKRYIFPFLSVKQISALAYPFVFFIFSPFRWDKQLFQPRGKDPPTRVGGWTRHIKGFARTMDQRILLGLESYLKVGEKVYDFLLEQRECLRRYTRQRQNSSYVRGSKNLSPLICFSWLFPYKIEWPIYPSKSFHKYFMITSCSIVRIQNQTNFFKM